MPNGITLSSTGVLAGIPLASGPFNFTVLVADGRIVAVHDPIA
ncbi:MAG: putative Ig domain-containing protein [Acidobacteria bacterium]|nr:putative Ig domain-containing protein [Acidobacteriota bacterium]